MIDRAKHAHYCNVYLRINGKDELYEADWIKCLSGPPLAKPATDLTPQRDRKWYDEGTPSDDADVNAKG
jgi:hypothetical protein